MQLIKEEFTNSQYAFEGEELRIIKFYCQELKGAHDEEYLRWRMEVSDAWGD